MIYRMNHDEQFLMHVIPPVESMKKLGAAYGTFAFDASPKRYLHIWSPLTLEFRSCSSHKSTGFPDISENFGRLFMSEHAHEILFSLLESSGEFLPINYEKGKGYIFNPLWTIEQFNGLDELNFAYDTYGNITHLAVNEKNIPSTGCMRTEKDSYKAIFCTENIKQACEAASLTGIIFSQDLANPLEGSFGDIH